jgi:hypothetical protein
LKKYYVLNSNVISNLLDHRSEITLEMCKKWFDDIDVIGYVHQIQYHPEWMIPMSIKNERMYDAYKRGCKLFMIPEYSYDRWMSINHDNRKMIIGHFSEILHHVLYLMLSIESNQLIE